MVFYIDWGTVVLKVWLIFMSSDLSADIMASLCGIRICMYNFSKRTRPRAMLLFLKDSLSIEDYKL